MQQNVRKSLKVNVMLELYHQIHAMIFDADRIPFAIAAILLTMVVGVTTGPLLGNANSAFVLFFDKVFAYFGVKLDKLHRSRADLMFRGFIFSAICLFFVPIFAEFCQKLAFERVFSGFAPILCVSVFVTSGSVWFSLLRLYQAVEKKQVGKGAYYAISHSTRTNLAATDDYGIARTGMGFAAKSFDKGMVAPIFWYLVAGFTGLVAYGFVSALAWRFGKQGFTKGFGAVPLALEKLMGIVPSLYAAVLITMASLFTPTAKLHKGVLSWFKSEGRASYEQGGFPLTAMAWPLGVSLGGATQDLSGSAIKADWVGPPDATAKNDHKHLRRALYINVIAHILFIASLLGAYMLAHLQ